MRVPVTKIVENIKLAIEETPPELLYDIVNRGIFLAGGGALIKGIKELLEKETLIRVVIADDPITCVARGAGMVIDKINLIKSISQQA
jgi:rod shape-determining protein MreB